MVIVGLDVGAVRIGVAVSDELELLASPRSVIRRTSNASAVEAIARVAREAGAGLVVVGLPISLDGKLHAQANAVRTFVERLRRVLPVPLVYADETLSTVQAEERLRASGVRPERMRRQIDAAAAAVILQDYLDQPPPRPDAAARYPELAPPPTKEP
jgi:putative Holliday junction resolvase